MSERKINGLCSLSYSLLFKIVSYVIGEILEVSCLVNRRKHIRENQKKYKRCKTELIYELSQVSKQFRDMFREKEINYNTCINYILLSRYQKYFIDLSEVLLRTGIITDLDKIRTTHKKMINIEILDEYTFTLTGINPDCVLINIHRNERYDTEIIWDTASSQIVNGMLLSFYRQCLRYIYAKYSEKNKYDWVKSYKINYFNPKALTYLRKLTIGEALHFIKDTILPNKENLYYILNLVEKVEAQASLLQ